MPLKCALHLGRPRGSSNIFSAEPVSTFGDMGRGYIPGVVHRSVFLSLNWAQMKIIGGAAQKIIT